MRIIALIAGWLLMSALRAADGIHRCVDPQGISIYTDQPCSAFDAVDREAEPATPSTPGATTPSTDLVRSDCAREADTLLFDLRRAIESDDINTVAGLYHWPGIRGRAAIGVMDRLERLIERPMASAELVYPESSPVREDPEAFPEGTPAEDPVAVRIEQTLAGDSVPSTVEELRLVRHADCWWLHF